MDVAGPSQENKFVLLASTIGPIDAGIVGALEEGFEKETGIRVRHVGAGTGAALKMAEKGQFDLVLAHAKSLEEKFVKDGFGTERIPLMYNDFVIVGPAADPAGIKGMKTSAEALRTIAAKKATFVSRGDKSGTHVAEMDLWKGAGIQPSGNWYVVYEKGSSGNIPTLRYANEKQVYTVIDRATYLSLKKEINLAILVENDKAMLNFMSLIPVNQAKFPRVNRAGVDLIADSRLQLQLGDRVTVVGSEEAIANVERFLGNSLKRLREPNLITIFIGIALGVLVGSIPFMIPGIPQPVKLGLAGGPLIVAILISKFGPKYKLVTYTTMSANLMLREIGIALFLACVGLAAGENFVETVVNGGYKWIGYGVIITVVPLLIIGTVGRKMCKLNYFTLMGLLAGSMTDPPALSYANAMAGNDMPSVSYATVYPLTMFLRVITAQLLILLFL